MLLTWEAGGVTLRLGVSTHCRGGLRGPPGPSRSPNVATHKQKAMGKGGEHAEFVNTRLGCSNFCKHQDWPTL